MKKNNSQEQMGNKPEKEVATSFKRTRGIIREEIKNSKASSYLESSSSHTPDTKSQEEELKKMAKKISFYATKIKKVPIRINFKTLDGKRISFRATKAIKVQKKKTMVPEISKLLDEKVKVLDRIMVSKKKNNPQSVKIDWQKVFYFSFVTETNNHKRRRVIPLNKLRKCIVK